MPAEVISLEVERAKRGLPPVLELPARCAPETPRHAREGDFAYFCEDCGAIYWSLLERGERNIGLVCAGCGAFRPLYELLGVILPVDNVAPKD